ncbi:MAG: hypothetical protein IJ654_03480 [Bacteroidales bacterium]|nr:hypothetical protein [Bacteroidales bacterium]
MKRSILSAALSVCLLSCTVETPSTLREFQFLAEFTPATRLHLEGTLSPLLSGRYWQWSAIDVLTLQYLDGEELASIPSTSVRLVSDGRSAVFTFRIPSSARAVSAEFGSAAAFGETCPASQDIPAGMVYARASIPGGVGEENLPAGVLRHACSYLLIHPAVPGKTVRSITVSGSGLKGPGSGAQTLTFPVEGTDPFWLALSNEAVGVVVEAADSQSGKTVLARLDHLGNGACELYEIHYKPIIDYRQ